MKDAVCTIITNDYGHYALALHDTLQAYGDNEFFYVFVTNGRLPEYVNEQLNTRERVFILDESNFKNSELAVQLKIKYSSTYHDAYRWGMKPVLMTYLLEHNLDRVIYVDSDVLFFSKFRFLFDTLNSHSILLSPHWRSSYPEQDLDNFKLNFLDGIYNGGFLGASKRGISALTYWAKLCLHECKVDRSEGYYVDQRYLDLLPTRFDGVGHLTHKGCNVANWNQIDCQRTLQDNGEVMINDTWPIVFIHFTNSMLRGVLLGEDVLLKPFLEKYKQTLLKYNDIDIVKMFYEKGRFESARKDVSELDNKKNRNTFLKRILKRIK
ncbi:hypothetical protein KFZ70_10165 [Tamlana fucoidanivorans]|uniref:Glycosyl transferase n=1 Tax=Allotamlana fucoidanivorans TaxID=2583814 RepID=A0A5C4SPX0_9FLAO|nr:hypothetical protein [Tamlana fucoidanivorans]TNJ45772.1 hypothetical protein FGF67_05160 [Tamlana fucoidanivorans]